MYQWLDKARQKSESARRRLAVLVAGGVTLLVFGIWYSMDGGSQSEKTVAENEPPISEVRTTPFSAVRDQVSTGWVMITDQMIKAERGMSNLLSGLK